MWHETDNQHFYSVGKGFCGLNPSLLAVNSFPRPLGRRCQRAKVSQVRGGGKLRHKTNTLGHKCFLIKIQNKMHKKVLLFLFYFCLHCSQHGQFLLFLVCGMKQIINILYSASKDFYGLFSNLPVVNSFPQFLGWNCQRAKV